MLSDALTNPVISFEIEFVMLLSTPGLSLSADESTTLATAPAVKLKLLLRCCNRSFSLLYVIVDVLLSQSVFKFFCEFDFLFIRMGDVIGD